MTISRYPRRRRVGFGILTGLLTAVLAAALLQPHAAAQTEPDQQTPGEAYEALGFGVFMHYGLATFVGRTPWNYDPHNFAPTVYDPPDFDPDQWMRAIKAAGAKYIILTTKHHDGFTMWPSDYTDYGVHNSSDPDTDVVGEVVRAARKHGLEVALYYSWWDKMEPGGNVQSGAPPTPEYIQYAKNQMRELLTQYGPVIGLWLDVPTGADLQDLADFIHGVSPETAFIPNFRLWVDNPTDAQDVTTFVGNAGGLMPCDYSELPAEQAYNMASGPGWWEMSADAIPRGDVDEATSVLASTHSLGATLSLNVSPGPSGQFSPAAVQLLEGIGDRVRGDNLLADGEVMASGEVGGHSAGAATDVLTKTHWEIPSADRQWLQVDLPNAVTINRTAVQLTGADVVSGYEVQYQDAKGRWRTAASGDTPMYPTQTDELSGITTSSLRLVVDGATPGAGVVELKAYGGLDDTSTAATYAGDWQALARPAGPPDEARLPSNVPWADAFNESIHRSRHAGDTATFTFTGNGITLHASVGPGQGTALVSVDGGEPELVDLYQVKASRDEIVYQRDDLEPDEHTLTVEVTGDQHEDATGSWVTLDRITPLALASSEPYEELPDGRLIYDDSGNYRCADNSPIEYSGSWSSDSWNGAHNDTRHFSNSAGDYAELTFEGAGVAVMTQTRPGHGIAAISIDGGEPELVDTYSNPPQEQVVVWERTGLEPGQHTVRIEVTGDSNPAASNRWVALDAIIVTP